MSTSAEERARDVWDIVKDAVDGTFLERKDARAEVAKEFRAYAAERMREAVEELRGNSYFAAAAYLRAFAEREARGETT